ncbi:MAG: 50S ribosomal protein L24 [Pseudomonadota bacterium]
MTAKKLKIKKGDSVIVTTGKDKGVKGEVLRVLKDTDRVIVSGANMITKHNKPGQNSAGGIEKIEASIHISNVAIADPKNDKPSRVGYKVLKDGTKTRFSKASGETLD